MSHFVQTKMSLQASRKSALKKALVNMGFQQAHVELSDTPMELKNYYGNREGQANIRIKGRGWGSENKLSRSSSDIGFEFKSNGEAVAHLDNMVFGEDWRNKLMVQYSREVIKEVAVEQGFFIDEEITNNNGELVITMTSPW